MGATLRGQATDFLARSLHWFGESVTFTMTYLLASRAGPNPGRSAPAVAEGLRRGAPDALALRFAAAGLVARALLTCGARALSRAMTAPAPVAEAPYPW